LMLSITRSWNGWDSRLVMKAFARGLLPSSRRVRARGVRWNISRLSHTPEIKNHATSTQKKHVSNAHELFKQARHDVVSRQPLGVFGQSFGHKHCFFGICRGRVVSPAKHVSSPAKFDRSPSPAKFDRSPHGYVFCLFFVLSFYHAIMRLCDYARGLHSELSDSHKNVDCLSQDTAKR
jgi:hypothetical protein